MVERGTAGVAREHVLRQPARAAQVHEVARQVRCSVAFFGGRHGRNCAPEQPSANPLDIALGLSRRRSYREGTRKENTMDSALQSLSGLRVAVTGGTSGLGLALVDQLKAAGAQVAFVARDAQRVSAVALRRPGTHGIAADVSDKTRSTRWRCN